MTKQLVKAAVPDIHSLILELHGQRVILDEDLARLYGVTTGALNQAIKRNLNRFPDDFMHTLDTEEVTILKSQIVTSRSWGGRRKLPRVFTEHGAVMAANVLRSPRAVQMSIEVVRAFNRLRQFALSHKDLAAKIDALEAKYDSRFQVVFDALRSLMDPPDPPRKKPIGFHTELEGSDGVQRNARHKRS